MRTRLASRVWVVAALMAFLTGDLFAGTASASTVLAPGCTGAVTGLVGDQVAVQGKDISDLVWSAAREQEVVLHLNGVDPDRLARAVIAEGALVVGEVPAAVSMRITGEAMARTVSKVLRNAGGLGSTAETKAKTLDAIRAKLAAACELTVVASDFIEGSPAPSQIPTAPEQPLPAVPPMPGVPVPSRVFTDFPVTGPESTQHPAGAYPPSTGEARTTTSGTAQDEQGVRNAGNADALEETQRSGTLELPTLLAVLALAAAGAALVRTWVLRKVS